MDLLKLFRRSTNSKSFIPEIDGLRFFSIITVMIYHMNTSYMKQIGMGWQQWKEITGVDGPLEIGWWVIRLDMGVKVFFAISGFILALPFLKHFLQNEKKVKLGDYFYRRLTRLEPPFIITLLLFLFVHKFILHGELKELLPHFLSGLLYSHVFIYGVGNPINPVTWSLETEAQFYILLPLILIGLFKLRHIILRIIFIATLVGLSVYLKSYFYFNQTGHLSSSILAYLSNFSLGVFFAWFYLVYGNTFLSKKSVFFDVIGLLAMLCMFVFYKPQAVWYNNILFNISILGLFFSVFKGKLSNWFYTRPVIYIIGGMCYSLYLLHYAFFYLIVKFTGGIKTNLGFLTDFSLQIILLLPAILIVGSVFYLTIEKPCMDKNWPVNVKNFLRTSFLKPK